MEKLWFVYSDEIVSGPFTTERVKRDILDGRWSADAQIWWKGQKEWITLDRWHQNLDEIIEAQKTQGQASVWYAEQSGTQFGPMPKTDLISLLKGMASIKTVRLWTVGLNHWTNLFEFHDILAQLGISKRGHDRAPIVGSVEIQRPGEHMEKTLASVSAGGLGIKDAQNLIPGVTVAIAIRSPLLINPVRATAKVMYVEDNGYAGLQFEAIHIEPKTTPIDYVRQFRGEVNTFFNDATQVRRVA